MSRNLRTNLILSGFSALTFAASALLATPASAEFFGCNDTRGRVLYSYTGTPSQYTSRSYSRRYTREYAAHSPRQRDSQQHSTDYSARHSWDNRSRW